MTAFTYTAKREIASGHSASTTYTIDVKCIEIKPGRDIKKNESRAMDGITTETQLVYNLKTWKITTQALVGTPLDYMREFLQSVIGGETLQFDEFGFAASPDNAISAILVGDYDEARAVRQGDGGAGDYFRFSFTIREN